MTAFEKALEIGKRAAGIGFDWPDAAGPSAKILEELDELQAAMQQEDNEQVVEELGDLLFAVASLARHLDVDPELALAAANAKFERRFRHLEQALRERGVDPLDLDIEALERHWQAAKNIGL